MKKYIVFIIAGLCSFLPTVCASEIDSIIDRVYFLVEVSNLSKSARRQITAKIECLEKHLLTQESTKIHRVAEYLNKVVPEPFVNGVDRSTLNHPIPLLPWALPLGGSTLCVIAISVFNSLPSDTFGLVILGPLVYFAAGVLFLALGSALLIYHWVASRKVDRDYHLFIQKVQSDFIIHLNSLPPSLKIPQELQVFHLSHMGLSFDRSSQEIQKGIFVNELVGVLQCL